MRIDLDTCRDHVALAAEVRRLQRVIDSEATLTDEEREAIAWCVEMATTTATECEDEVAALRGLLERTR